MNKKCLVNMVAALGALMGGLQPGAAWASADQPFVGQIMWVPFNFAPKNWAMCDGQLLPISQNTALFSLLGTYYGGDGKSTFALPNMQGRVLVHQGQSTLGTEYIVGQADGSETVTLTQAQIPNHTHDVSVDTAVADQASPANHVLGQAAGGYLYGTNPTATMAPDQLAIQGGGQPHNNMMPYLTLTCIIATQGIFPPRP